METITDPAEKMDAIAAILACLFGSQGDTYPDTHPTDRKGPRPSADTLTLEHDIASDILDIIRNADKNDHKLKAQVSVVVSAQGWTENIAKAVVKGLEYLITEGREKVGKALREAIDKAEAAAKECFAFAKEHPYITAGFATIVAVGVLVLIAPWAVEALGFGELGPIAGKSWPWIWDVFPC
ncbi:hypothetical protein IMZ48_00825 [Candidatus Bathyarchaeota archaeon]|nr:hypothetical protein [Candidatus Bathyarchaeota archaeon]